MEPANKPSVAPKVRSSLSSDKTAFEFLPDADEIERRPLPRVARITLHVLGLTLASFIAWANFSEVDLIVTARGRLVTPLPNIVVQPMETGVIQTMDVRVGHIVKKGDRLASLDPTFSKADEAQLQARLQSLDTQLQSMEADLAGNKKPVVGRATADSEIQSRLSTERQASYASQLRRLQESIARARSALETTRQDEMAMASRVKVLREMEGMTDDLVSKKLAVRSRLLDAKDRLLEAERSMDMARNRQAELRRELAALEAERASFETGWRQKLLEEVLAVSRERESVNEQLQKASRRHSLVVLTAPADAVVLEVAKLSPGSVVREAELLFTLVPLGGTLEAEVQIDSQDIGYLKVGDEAHVKLDAYPFQRHGTLTAALRTISEDAFRRENNPGAGMDAYYSSRISLKSLQLKNMAERSKLLPGMTLTAEIQVGKRSVMSYLMWPLMKAFNESIREP